MFQFCYISSENQTYGVSEPFQFINSAMKLTMLSSIKSLCDSDYSSINFEKEISKLHEENKYFREKLQVYMGMLISCQTLLCQQQKEINNLKERCNVLEEDQLLLGLKQNLCNNPSKILSAPAFCSDFDIGELETLPPFPFSK